MNNEQPNLGACEAFENRLQELLDLRQLRSDDVELAVHAKKCEDCAQLFTDYLQLFDHSSLPLGTQVNDVSISGFQGGHVRWLVCKTNKWMWSLAPTFAALLLVMLSMILDGRPMERSELALDSLASVPGRYHPVVSGRELEKSIVGESASKEWTIGNEISQRDPFSQTLFPRDGIIHGVHQGTHALYEYYASPHTYLPNTELIQLEVVDRVTNPLGPIRQAAPWSQEFAVLPQFRYLYSLATELLKRTKAAFLNQPDSDLGLQQDYLAFVSRRLI